MGRSVRRVLLSVGVLFGTVALIGCSNASSTTSVSTSEPCHIDVFDESFVAELDDEFADLAVTAAVHDLRSGCWYHVHEGMVLTTASAIKLQVLGAVADRAERLGRELDAVEVDSADRMIHFSHNSPPTGVLYDRVGVSGMTAFSAAVGAESTRHSSIYGVTSATAEDLSRVAVAVLAPNSGSITSPLEPETRADLRAIVAGVHHTQQWGIGEGAPDGWTALNKNGFFPCTSCAPFSGTYTWRVASTGVWIDDDTQDTLALTVLTDGAQTQQRGMEAIRIIARHVGETLLDAGPGDRPFDHARCVAAESGESGASIARRLGLGDRWSDIRWVSGNEGPMRGQLLCAPEPADNVEPCLCPDAAWRRNVD